MHLCHRTWRSLFLLSVVHSPSVCMHMYIMLPLVALNHFLFLFCITLPDALIQVSVLSCYSLFCPGSLHLMNQWNWIHVNLAELWAIVFKCFVIPVLCSPSGTAVKHTLGCLILSFTTRVLPLALYWPLELCLNSGSYWLTCSAHNANSLKKFFLTVRVLYVVCCMSFFFLNRVKRSFFF